jgi:hypothetical protein
MIPVTILADRWVSFRVNNWILDSGAFGQLFMHGKFDMSTKAYAREIDRWKLCGNLVGAVAQDYICDPLVREKTRKSVEEHQALTIRNYVDLLSRVNGTRILPVIQGYRAKEYAQHVRDYGSLLKPHQWVAVGSIVSRSNDPVQILRILEAIKSERSDIHLHGFGLKTRSLRDTSIRNMLFSSDSISWSRDMRYESWERLDGNGKELKKQMLQEEGGYAKWRNLASTRKGDNMAKLQYDPRVALRFAIEMQELCGEEHLTKWWTYEIKDLAKNVSNVLLK